MRYSEFFTTLCIIFLTITVFATTYKPAQFKYTAINVKPTESVICRDEMLDFTVEIKVLRAGVVQRVESIFRMTSPQETIKQGNSMTYIVWGKDQVGLLIKKEKHIDLKGLEPGKYVFNGSVTQLGSNKSSIYSIPFSIIDCKPTSAF